jgi:hypothetical protein
MDSEFKTVKVLPFIGKNYGKPDGLGVRILILGESHYNPIGGPLHRTFTRDVLENHSDKHRVFGKIVRMFYDRKPDEQMKRQFWKTVAFYNFIQESVGDAPRIRPTRKMWEQAPQALREVLMLCRPGFVLVLGKELRRNLGIEFAKGPAVQLANGRTKHLQLYDDDTPFFAINHPSSPGWSHKTWTPWVGAALVAAIRFKKKA